MADDMQRTSRPSSAGGSRGITMRTSLPCKEQDALRPMSRYPLQ